MDALIGEMVNISANKEISTHLQMNGSWEGTKECQEKEQLQGGAVRIDLHKEAEVKRTRRVTPRCGESMRPASAKARG